MLEVRFEDEFLYQNENFSLSMELIGPRTIQPRNSRGSHRTATW